jgi:hypothetical protein
MRGGTIATTAFLIGAISASALAGTKPPPIGVEVKERAGNVIPVKLSCPFARESCKGEASFKGRKEYKGKIYKLAAAPFKFREFDGGTSKTIKFRLGESAQGTLERSNGMKVKVIIKAEYGSGKPGTVRVKTTLAP